MNPSASKTLLFSARIPFLCADIESAAPERKHCVAGIQNRPMSSVKTKEVGRNCPRRKRVEVGPHCRDTR